MSLWQVHHARKPRGTVPSDYVYIDFGLGEETSFVDLDFGDFTWEEWAYLGYSTPDPAIGHRDSSLVSKMYLSFPFNMGWELGYVLVDYWEGETHVQQVVLNAGVSPKLWNDIYATKYYITTKYLISDDIPAATILNKWSHFALTHHTVWTSEWNSTIHDFEVVPTSARTRIWWDGTIMVEAISNFINNPTKVLPNYSDADTPLWGGHELDSDPLYKFTRQRQGWMRLSGMDRSEHFAGDGPDPRTVPPDIDVWTIGQWLANEGTGNHLDNSEGTAGNDGDIVQPAWAGGVPTPHWVGNTLYLNL